MSRRSPQLLVLVSLLGACKTQDAAEQGPSGPTYAEEIAPILHAQCLDCHREGGSAPFSLASYEAAKSHASQIAEVTASGYMPPWLPNTKGVRFVGERHLSANQKQLLAQWADAGAPRGKGDPPAPPEVPSDGWALGTPDFVAVLEGYTLPADGEEGSDVYRNFVLPLPLQGREFIKTIEIKTDKPQVIHHAVLRVDSTSDSRSRDADDEVLGFSGMVAGQAVMPDGLFLGWTPGKRPFPGERGRAFHLDPGTDGVLQLHMRPTGKDEPIKVTVGFYRADAPPTRPSLALLLTSRDIDLAPGDTSFEATDSYVLPTDVTLHSIYPHAHYLGQHLQAFVTKPDGPRQTLIEIEDWDFDWQDEFRLSAPMSLPVGTKIEMVYRYDNSADNPDNPNDPPQRVVFGARSVDEMAELILEVSPTDPQQLGNLDSHMRQTLMVSEVEYFKRKAEADPDDPSNHVAVANRLFELRQADASRKAYERAVEADPTHEQAHLGLGQLSLALDDPTAAIGHFERATEVAPRSSTAFSRLGLAHKRADDLPKSIAAYEKAIELEPGRASIHNNLAIALLDAGELEQAQQRLLQAIALEPPTGRYWENLGRVRVRLEDDKGAIEAYEQALLRNPNRAQVLVPLAFLLAAAPDTELRDAARAKSLAQGGLMLTNHKSPRALDAAAVTAAANEEWEAAQKLAEQGLGLAEASEDDELARTIKRRIKGYAKQRPVTGFPPR